jgi:transcriptional regulator
VIAALEQLGTPSSTELAQWMRWHREQAARSD